MCTVNLVPDTLIASAAFLLCSFICVTYILLVDSKISADSDLFHVSTLQSSLNLGSIGIAYSILHASQL